MGMIFTSFVSFLVFSSAFVTGLFIFKKRNKENKFFKKKIVIRTVVVVYSVTAFFGVFLLSKFGFTEGESTYFVDKLFPNDLAFFVFTVMIVLLFFASVLDSLRGAVGWLKKKEPAYLYVFFV